MNLFINAISSEGKLILFNDSRQILDSENLNILGNESSKLTGLIDLFIDKNNIDYSKIKNIVVVNGPGSFTGVRIITLVVNTISFINKYLKITPLNFFSMFESYPIIKSSSKRDLFVKKSKSDKIEIIKSENFLNYTKEKNIDLVFGDYKNNLIEGKININSKIDYEKILLEIKLENKDIISPLYIKKPNIT